MSSLWLEHARNTIYTIVKTRTLGKLRDRFPNLSFTEDLQSLNKTNFPTVYVHYMPTAELAKDLERCEINAITCSVQIEVYCSKEQGQTSAETIMYAVIDEYHKLMFDVQTAPEFLNARSDTERLLCRMRRTICKNDF